MAQEKEKKEIGDWLPYVIGCGMGLAFFKMGTTAGRGLGKVSHGYGLKGSLVVLVLFCLWFYVHIMIHEAGHLIAGLMKGYTFVSFRIGSMVWMKEKGKWVIKKMVLKGTGGQCLMCPPKVKPEACPFNFYLAGGGIANLVVALVGLVIYLVLPKGMMGILLGMEPAIVGILTGLSNLMPLKVGGIANDGYNLFIELRKNKKAKEALYHVLTLNAYLSEKERFEEIPKDYIETIMAFECMDLTNGLVANVYNNQAFIHFARGEYEKAKACNLRLIETKGVMEIFKNEAKCDLLLLELIGTGDTTYIETAYNKKLQQYIKVTSCYPSRKALMYGYYKLYEKDDKKAKQAYDAFEKCWQQYPSKVEANVALGLMQLMEAKENSRVCEQ